MKEQLKDKLARAVHRRLKLSGVANAMEISERLLEDMELVIDMETQESGVADVPSDTAADMVWDIQKNEPLSPVTLVSPPSSRTSVVSAAPKQPERQEKPIILVPGDPEFNKAREAAPDLPKPKVLTGSAIRRPTRPASNTPAVQYWDEGDLIQQLLDNTPLKLQINTENREGRPVTVIVERNTLNQAGTGNIVLSYKAPQVSETDGYLVARHTFSVYNQEFNLETAMADIMQQLEMKYRPKPESMQPVMAPEVPLRLDMRNQPGDFHSEQFEPGRTFADPMGQAMSNTRHSNDQLAPPGRRF